MAPINVGVLIVDNKPAATASASGKCCSVCIRGTKLRETPSTDQTTIGFCMICTLFVAQSSWLNQSLERETCRQVES